MVTKDVLEAYARLSGDPSFRVVMDDIKRRKEAARDGLEDTADQLSTGRLQGESRLCSEIIGLYESARSALEKTRAR